MTAPTILTPSANGAIPVVPSLQSTLSADGLTWSNTGNDATSGQAFGDNPLSEGSYYFETTLTSFTAGNCYYIGVCSTAGRSTTQNVVFAGNHSCDVGNFSNSQVVLNGAGAGINLGAPNDGDVISVAVSLPNLVWFRLRGGNWNNNASADPETGVGGIDISGFTAPIVPFVSAYEGACTLLFNFGQTGFAYTPPALFGDWPGAETITVTSVTAVSGEPWEIEGTTANGVAAALDYSIDAGATWVACGGYTAGPTWSVTGPTITGGASGNILIRDHTTLLQSMPFPYAQAGTIPSYFTNILTADFANWTYGSGNASGSGNEINIAPWTNGGYPNCVAAILITPEANSSHWQVDVDYDITAWSQPGSYGSIPNPLAFEMSAFRELSQTDPSTIFVIFDRDTAGDVERGTMTINGPKAGPVAVAYPITGHLTIKCDYDAATGITVFSVTANGTVLYQSPAGGDVIGATTLGEFIIQVQGNTIGPHQGAQVATFSNLFAYDTTPPAEALVITAAVGTGGAVALSGTNVGQLAVNMDYILDAGTWAPVDPFSSNAAWSGTGPVVLSGTHMIQVRDHDVPTVLSNTETFTVGVGVFFWDGVKVHA